MRVDNIIPPVATPPCDHILDEMEARGITPHELAARMDVPESDLSNLLAGRTRITADMATRLEAAFGIPADLWLRFQLGYEKDLRAITNRDEAK